MAKKEIKSIVPISSKVTIIESKVKEVPKEEPELDLEDEIANEELIQFAEFMSGGSSSSIAPVLEQGDLPQQLEDSVRSTPVSNISSDTGQGQIYGSAVSTDETKKYTSSEITGLMGQSEEDLFNQRQQPTILRPDGRISQNKDERAYTPKFKTEAGSSKKRYAWEV
jgi:hypothetical protein